MAASKGQLQRYIYFRNCNCDAMLKRNEVLWIFLSKGLGKGCKHTELA